MKPTVFIHTNGKQMGGAVFYDQSHITASYSMTLAGAFEKLLTGAMVGDRLGLFHEAGEIAS